MSESTPRLLRVTPAASVGVVTGVLLCFWWTSIMVGSDLRRSANLNQLRLVSIVGIGIVILLRVGASPGIRSHAAEFIRGVLLALLTLVSITWLFVHLL